MTAWDRRTVLQVAGVAAPMLFAAPGAAAEPDKDETITVNSPDGKLSVTLHLPTRSEQSPRWSVAESGTVVVEASRLALVLDGGRLLGPKARLERHRIDAIDESWSPPFGIASHYDGKANRLEAFFHDPRSGIRFAILLLAHNDGAAFRFSLLGGRKNRVTLGGEACEFRFPVGTQVWSSRDEGEYARSAPGLLAPVPHPDLTASTDKGPLADTPLLAEIPEGPFLSIGESDRLHYPRLMFAPGSDPQTVATHLMRFPGRATGYSGPGETHAAPTFEVELPFKTPWRLVTVAREPAKLLEKAGLTTTLASPNRLGDISWVKPGRAFRIRKPYTMDRAREGLRFAVARRLDFIEFDAHWYGDGTDPSDATRPIEGLDMPAIVAAARAEGLGTILYVDRVPAMRQLDAIVRTYRDWGVAGIKFGFVWEGRQEDVDFIYDLVKTCGENRLLVNLHDNLRPAGLERTLPNYLALEGVRGNEQFPTARHNVTLPFTRALSGPIDYTICYDHYKNLTTNAHQLAMAAVYYNPLTFLYWYDEPDKYLSGPWPALRWFDECPTSWDETRALAGAPGEYVVVARRHGARWYLGAMTNEGARAIELATDFLGGGDWRATRFSDGAPGSEARLTAVVIDEVRLRAGDSLHIAMAPSGGQAILFEPIESASAPSASR